MNSEDHQLFQLLDQELFKKAIQFVAALQKRYPSATYYKILEQYVRFRQSSSKYSFEKGLQQFLDAKSPPNDAKSLGLCHRFLLELGFDTTRALEPYERAMMKYGNPETCYDWFLESLKDLNWRHLSKSSFQMCRVNEKSKIRYFQFCNSVSTVVWLQLDRSNISAKELELLPKLTYKLTCDMKPFTNEQELIVFCQVCELFGSEYGFESSANKSQEIVDEILRFWKQGTYLDLYLKNFLMAHLVKLKDHQRTWECGVSLLRNLDDYQILQQAITAAHSLNKPFPEVCESLLNYRSTRNYMLARIVAAQLYDEQTELKQSLQQFLARYHDKPSCPVDIQSLGLDNTQLEQMFDTYPSGLVHDKAVAQLFHKNNNLELFLKHKSSLATKPKTDYSNCSYFLLEIVKDLCQDDNVSLQNVITAVSLLEGYQAEDPFNYDTRLWLVVLYTYLGLPEKAYQHLETLNVKNVQNDLLNHLLFTRFSTTLPNKNYTYCQKALQPQAIYSSLKSMNGFIVAAFERKSWCKVPGIIEFYQRVFRSFSRWGAMAETLQMARLLNERKLDQYTPLLESLNVFGLSGFSEEAWADNRDFDILDSEAKTRFRTILAPILVDSKWLKQSIARELVYYSLAKNEPSRFVDEALSTASCCASAAENWAWQVSQLLYKSIASEQPDYAALTALVEKCPEPADATWSLNHTYLITLATLKPLDQTKRIKHQPVRNLIKSKLKLTRDRCVTLYQQYQDAVTRSGDSENKLLNATHYQDLSKSIAFDIAHMLKAIRNL